jgi:hypothetical protein
VENGLSEDDAEFRRFVEHFAQVLSFGTRGPVTLDEQSISRIEELTKEDRNEKLRRHFELIGQLMTAMASLEESVRVLASHYLNPSEPGRAASAIRSTSASATLQIVADSMQSRWPQGKALVDEIREVQRLRNEFAHNGLSHWHIEDSSVIEGVYLEIPDRRNRFSASFREVSTRDIQELIERSELAAKVIVLALQASVASTVGDTGGTDAKSTGDDEIEVSAFVLALRVKASGFMRSEDGEDFFTDDDMVKLALYYTKPDELEALRLQANDQRSESALDE